MIIPYENIYNGSDQESLLQVNGYSTDNKQAAFKGMQTHLSYILAHYMAYIACHLGLPFQKESEQFVIAEAHSRWRKEGSFLWRSSEENFLPTEFTKNKHHEAEDAGPESAINQRTELEKRFRAFTTSAGEPDLEGQDRGAQHLCTSWEHAPVQEDRLECTIQHMQEDPRKKRFVCRKEKLSPEKRIEAQVQRKAAACWSCNAVSVSLHL